MASNQLETGLTVIEVHILPIARIMTFCAVIAHLPLMDIQMARGTRGRRIFEGKILVTVHARHVNMFAKQSKGSL